MVENRRETNIYFLDAIFKRIQLGSGWLCNFVITTALVFLPVDIEKEVNLTVVREKRTNILQLLVLANCVFLFCCSFSDV